MSIQEKFEKAVNVIRNLPKNGSYQPSNELQLRFYAYFKQASEGPNFHPKPSFWEVVKRAKWEAWAKLGNMTKEEAMMHYVEELRKIVETMSYTDNVATFLNSLDNFYENVPPEDLELLVGPIIEKIRSQPGSPLNGSPLASRDTSPMRLNSETSRVAHNTAKHITSSLETSPASSYSASPLPPDTDDDDDHFLDTQTEPDRSKEGNPKNKEGNTKKSRGSGSSAAQSSEQVREPSVGKTISRVTSGSKVSNVANGDIVSRESEPVHSSITVIRKDVETLKNRLQTVETSLVNKPNQAIYSKGDSLPNQDHKLLPPGTSTVTSEAFRRAIENMTKEVENLHRRMATLETKKQQEASVSRRKSGSILPRWWGVPLQTTAFFLAWPLIVMLVSRWIMNRRKR